MKAAVLSAVLAIGFSSICIEAIAEMPYGLVEGRHSVSYDKSMVYIGQTFREHRTNSLYRTIDFATEQMCQYVHGGANMNSPVLASCVKFSEITTEEGKKIIEWANTLRKSTALARW